MITMEQLDNAEAYNQIEWAQAGNGYQRSFYIVDKYQIVQNTMVPYARNWMAEIKDWWWLDYSMEITVSNCAMLKKYSGKLQNILYAEDNTGICTFDTAEDMLKFINEILETKMEVV